MSGIDGLIYSLTLLLFLPYSFTCDDEGTDFVASAGLKLQFPSNW